MQKKTDNHVITEVRAQRKRATRRSIFLDGEFAFGVSEEAYVKFALFTGREVSEDFIREVKEWENRYQGRQIALRYVNVRMRSRSEIEKKLREKELDPETIAATIEFLQEYDLTDDEAFARAWVNDQLLKRRLGRKRLEAGLREKGVDRGIVERVLDERFGKEEELEQAMLAAERKAPTIRHDDRMKWERSMTNFLVGRGFSWETIRQVMEKYRNRD